MRTTLLNKLVLFAAVAPAALWAADVWEAKPFQNWTQKDVQKIFNNSPWGRQARAVIGGTPPAPAGRSGQPAVGDASSNDSGVPKGREPGGVGRLGSAPSDVDQGPQSQVAVPVIVRWQSALPLRQAQMLAKYGDSVAISPEAQKFLTDEPAIYVVAIVERLGRAQGTRARRSRPLGQRSQRCRSGSAKPGGGSRDRSLAECPAAAAGPNAGEVWR